MAADVEENTAYECPLYLVPLQQGLRVMELFVLKTEFPLTYAPFGLTLMSLQCQGLQSGSQQEGLIKRKFFP